MTGLRCSVFGWVCALALAAQAAELDPAAEKARITRERTQTQARFNDAKHRCEAEFAVTACMDKAKAERRANLDRLRREQSVLDDAQRRQRAAQRLRSIQQRARASDERSLLPQQNLVAPRQAASAPAPHVSKPPHAPDPAASVAKQAAAAKERSAQAQRQRDAETHRLAVTQRNAERDKHKTPAAPLPAPSAASR